LGDVFVKRVGYELINGRGRDFKRVLGCWRQSRRIVANSYPTETPTTLNVKTHGSFYSFSVTRVYVNTKKHHILILLTTTFSERNCVPAEAARRDLFLSKTTRCDAPLQ
jgi:hypothetical protein